MRFDDDHSELTEYQRRLLVGFVRSVQAMLILALLGVLGVLVAVRSDPWVAMGPALGALCCTSGIVALQCKISRIKRGV